MNKYLYLRHLKRTLVLALIFQFLTIPLYPSVAVSRVYAITIGECFNLVANGDLDPSTDCASYAQPAPPPSEPEPVYTPPAPDEPPAPVYQQPRYNPPPRYTPPVYEPDPVYEEPQPDPIIEPETPAQTEPVYTQEPIVPVTKSAYEACLEEHPYDEYCDRVFFGQSEQPATQPVTEEPGLATEEEKTWWETATEWPSEAWEWIKETAAESGQSISEVIEGSGDKIASLFGSNDDSSGGGSGIPTAPQPQDPEWATKIAAAQSDWEIYKTQAASEDPALAAQTRAQTIAALGLPPESTDAEVIAALNKGLENSGLKFSGTPSDMTVEAGEPTLTEDDSSPGVWAAAGMVARLADGLALNGAGGVVYDFVYGTGEEARDSALSYATGGGSDAIKSAIASGQEWKETADNLDELVFNKPEVWSALRDDPTIYDDEGNILMPELARATRRYYQTHGTPEEKAIAENAVNSSEEAESKQTEGIAQAGALAAGLFMGGAAGGGIKGALANLYLPIGVDDAVINFANAKNEARIANAIPEAKAPGEVAPAPVKPNEPETPVKEAPVKEIASAADEPEGATWYKPWTWFNSGKSNTPEENLAVGRETEDPQLPDSEDLALKTKPIQGAPEPPAVARAEPELPKSELQVPAKVQEPEAKIPDEVDSELAIPVEQKLVSIEEARSARSENPVKPAEEEVTVPGTEPQEPTPIRPQEEDVPAKLPCAASLPLRFQLVKGVFAAEPCSLEQIAALETKNEEAQDVLAQANKKIEGELRSNVEPYRQEADDIQARIFEYENREVRQNGRPRQEVRSDPEYLGLRQQLIDASNKANQAEEDLVQSLKGDYLDLKQEAVKARDELDAGIASRGQPPLGYTDPGVKAKTEEVLGGFGLKDDDLVYRTVPAQYVKDGEIEAVISPTALIKNVYGNDELIQSWQLAGPGLNVTRTNKGNYGANNPGNVVVGIKVADLKAAGAKFYPDEGSLVDDALMVELPGSKVKVARVYDNPVKSAFYDAGDWLKGNIQRPVANAADSLLQRVGLKEAPVSKIADVPESKIGSGVEAGRSDDLAGKGEGDVSAPCPIPPQASLFNFVKEVYAAGPCPVKVSGANAEANPTYHTADDRKLEFKEKGGVVMDGMSNDGKGSGGVAADKASPVLAKIDNLPREGDPNIIAGQMEAIFTEADRVVSNDPGTYRLPGGYTLTPNATLDPSGKPVVTRSGSTFNGTRGTTATSTIIVHHNGREYAVTAYVGDSPAYIKRGDQLIKLTPNPEGVAGNVLGNYIGVSRRGRPFKVQTTIQELLPGDQILIASDGVSIPDSHIRGIMNSNPRDAAVKIVKASKDAGQKDDVTALLIKPEVGASAPQTYSPYRRGGQPVAARPAIPRQMTLDEARAELARARTLLEEAERAHDIPARGADIAALAEAERRAQAVFDTAELRVNQMEAAAAAGVNPPTVVGPFIPARTAQTPAGNASSPISTVSNWIASLNVNKVLLATLGSGLGLQAYLTVSSWFGGGSGTTPPATPPTPAEKPAQVQTPATAVPPKATTIVTPTQVIPPTQQPTAPVQPAPAPAAPNKTQEIEAKITKEADSLIAQVSKVTVTKDKQPGCSPNNESIISTEYSDGSVEIIKNFGKIPGECKNPLPGEIPACSRGTVKKANPYTQCGGSVGMESELKGVNYQVTPVYICKEQMSVVERVEYEKVALNNGMVDPKACPVEAAVAEKLKTADSFVQPGGKCSFDWECASGYSCDSLYKVCAIGRRSFNAYYSNKPEDKQKYEACHNLSVEIRSLNSSTKNDAERRVSCYQDLIDSNSKYNGRNVQLGIWDFGAVNGAAPKCEMRILDYGPGVNCPKP